MKYEPSDQNLYDSILYLIRFQQRIVFDIKDRTSFDFMQKCENYRVKGNDGCTGSWVNPVPLSSTLKKW